MTLTPATCRAGRALLRWTQRKLAAEAHVAQATVADFERGARDPIANNLRALKWALEDGGVRFNDGHVWLYDPKALKQG